MRNSIKKNLYLGILTFSIFTLVSCSEDVEVTTDTSINYTLTISPDLLKFVTPQVSYVDEYGALVIITGVEELDSIALENSSEVSMDGIYSSSWSQMTITGTGYKAWTIKMKFNHLGFHSHMAVKYLKNEFAEDPSGKIYDFHHDIQTSVHATKITKTTKGWLGGESVDMNTYTDYHVSICDEYRAGDDVNTYINNLIGNPDKAGYLIDENGDVTRKDEFDL